MIILFHLDTSENISGESKMNGHENSPREKPDNKSDESDEENPVIQPGNGHEKEEEKNNLTNGKNNTEQDLNEQVAMAAAAAISGDSDKPTITTNEDDPISRRKFQMIYLLIINFIFDILARPMAERTPNPVFEVVSEDILQVKIADLGNACWTVCLKIQIFCLIFFLF